MNLETPEQINRVLQATLKNIGEFEQCALLDYPDYVNVGDHLIWLGTVFYLSKVLKTKIQYAASLYAFSAAKMEKKIGKAPILLQGGGNFGDLWPEHQIFREKIIEQYRDRPIVILPQSIYYSNSDNLKRTASIFNAHPNLTIFTRDRQSYELARQNFSNCQVFKAPDMIFALAELSLPKFQFNPDLPVLYLCRNDSELNQAFDPAHLGISNGVVQDWISSSKWMYKGKENIKDYWKLPALATIVREVWQRRLSAPQEWMARRQWQQHPDAKLFNAFNHASIQGFSAWEMMHCGVYQVMQNKAIITNRLHGHLLCVLLGIPHIFLPNSYYKNEFFYQEWTYQIPYAKFIKEPSQVKGALEELMAGVSQKVKPEAI